MSNADHVFHGSIPELYDRFMGPAFFEPYATDLASRVRALAPAHSAALLELAAGTGVLSRALARSLPPEISILATDLNQPMLDYAARVSDPRILFRQADALHLPFPNHSFDFVLCQFGVMFFPDKLAAYREVRRVLKPAGRFFFSVWDRLDANELSLAVAQALKDFFGGDPPAFISRTPFGYFDIPQIHRELAQAAFRSSSVQTVALSSVTASTQDLALGMIQGTPLRNELESREPGLLDRVTTAVAASLASRFGPGPFHSRMQAHIFAALP